MPDLHPSFFEPAQLRADFLASLQQAVDAQQLTLVEQSELTSAILNLPSSSGRFYTLKFYEILSGAPSLAGALVIDGAGEADSHKCYLYTICHGIKAFAHGTSLLEYLNGVGIDPDYLKITLPPEVHTLGGVAAQEPEAILIKASLQPVVGDVFAAQRISWLRWRSQGLEAAVDCLTKMPSVESSAGVENILYLIDLFWILNGPAYAAFERVYRDAFIECWLSQRASGSWPRAGRTMLERGLLQLNVMSPTMRVIDVQGYNVDYNFAGALAFTDPELGCILYLPEQGLTYHASQSQLLMSLATNVQVRGTLGMAVRELFDTPGERELRLGKVSTDPVVYALRSIIDVQRTNLITALDITRTTEHSAINSIFDDVLDIRRLIDPYLKLFDLDGRWRDAKSVVEMPADMEREPSTAEADIRALIANCGTWRQEQILAGPSITQLVEQLLQPSLVILGGGLKASQVFLQARRQGKAPLDISMQAALLERVTGKRPGPFPKHTKVALRSTVGNVVAPPLEWVEEALGRAAPLVLKRWSSLLSRLLWSGFRQNGRWWSYSSLMEQTRQKLMALDIEWVRRKQTVAAPQLNAFKQALSQPGSVQTLVALDTTGHARARLREVVVLSTNTTAEGSWVCWSADQGMEVAPSQAALFAHWLAVLADKDRRARLLGAAQPREWRDHLPADVALIIQPLSNESVETSQLALPERLRLGVCGALTVQEANARLEEVEPLVQGARHLNMAGDAFGRLLTASMCRDALQPAIARLQRCWGQLELEHLIFEHWPRATDQDKQLFQRHVARILAINGRHQEFLADMPDPRALISQGLAHHLAGLGEWHVPSADRLMVVDANAPQGTVGASFIDYAMQHRPKGSSAAQVRTTDGSPIPVLVSQLDVNDLVRAVDWGKVLAKWFSVSLSLPKFSDTSRIEKMIQAMSWQIALTAHVQHLQGTLTGRGLRLVEHMVLAPDAIARATLPTDFVRLGRVRVGEQVLPGCFVIESTSGGPVVLLCLYHPEDAFREFEDLRSFESAFADASMLNEFARQYGFALAEHRVSKRSLAGNIMIDWLQGNALSTLFLDARDILQRMASTQFSEDGHVWNHFKELVEHILERGALILPQPLRRLFQGWKVIKEVGKVYKAVSERRWNDLFEDIVAVGGTAVGVPGTAPDSGAAANPPSAVSSQARISPDFSWRATGIDADLRERLLPYEERMLTLQAPGLQPDGSYRVEGNTYIVLGGKVFQIEQGSQGWRIVKAGHPQGPRVERGAGDHWRLANYGLHGGGCTGPCGYASDAVLSEVGEDFNIQAASLSALWAKYPAYADLLHRALSQIARWLTRAWQRLSPLGGIEIPVLQCFATTFGPIRASETNAAYERWEADLTIRLRKMVEQLHGELIRLRAGRGERWVYGHNSNQHP